LKPDASEAEHVIEAMTVGWPFAVARLRSKIGPTSISVACAFCFDTPDGFAFVEPSYADPHNTGHAFHRIVASLEVFDDGFAFDGPEWSGTVECYEPTAQQIREIGGALEWFEGHLEQNGIVIADERARIKATLAEDLA